MERWRENISKTSKSYWSMAWGACLRISTKCYFFVIICKIFFISTKKKTLNIKRKFQWKIEKISWFHIGFVPVSETQEDIQISFSFFTLVKLVIALAIARSKKKFRNKLLIVELVWFILNEKVHIILISRWKTLRCWQTNWVIRRASTCVHVWWLDACVSQHRKIGNIFVILVHVPI